MNDELSSSIERPRVPAARRWNIAAVLLAIIAAAAVTLLPLASSATDSVVTNDDGTSMVETTTSHTSLLSSEGPSVLAVSLFPALFAAAPLIIRTPIAERRTRVASTVLLGVLVILGAASIGLAFVPALLMMIAALASTPSRPGPPATAADAPAHP